VVVAQHFARGCDDVGGDGRGVPNSRALVFRRCYHAPAVWAECHARNNPIVLNCSADRDPSHCIPYLCVLLLECGGNPFPVGAECYAPDGIIAFQGFADGSPRCRIPHLPGGTVDPPIIIAFIKNRQYSGAVITQHGALD
jgi:hypothetical protein